MIRASLIYTAVTILLAFIDAYRIKKAKGVVENINHEVSANYAIYGGAITLVIWTAISYKPGEWHWHYIPKVELLILAFVFIRLAFYDIFLNIARRMKVDYESPTTSSYVDQHTNKLSFWEKRAIGLAGWAGMVIVHYLIFKS